MGTWIGRRSLEVSRGVEGEAVAGVDTVGGDNRGGGDDNDRGDEIIGAGDDITGVGDDINGVEDDSTGMDVGGDERS